ncbi:unnamed protein product, partial [Rotaria sp. Silwood2]
MTAVERLKREIREEKTKVFEEQNELIQLRKKQDKEHAAIRANLRLQNPCARLSSSSSVTAAYNVTMTTLMPVAKPSRKHDHSGRSTISLTENQKENI